MTPRILTVTYDAQDAARVARFWGAMLGREVTADGDGLLLAGTPAQVGLRFVPRPTQPAGPEVLHLHLTSASPDDQDTTVATALELGAAHLDVGQLPEEGHIVLADPEGNAFCVIEPDNKFLAGCGPLGEIACDGGREVGAFWSAALDWPLVWDQDEETAIQSPQGGTKVAWGGPPSAPKKPGDRQRFHLVAPDGDQQAEIDRLISLGATRLDTGPDGSVLLVDPGGNEFAVAKS